MHNPLDKSQNDNFEVSYKSDCFTLNEWEISRYLSVRLWAYLKSFVHGDSPLRHNFQYGLISFNLGAVIVALPTSKAVKPTYSRWTKTTFKLRPS